MAPASAGHDPGGDAERGLADIECVEQRASRGRGGAHREPADRPAGGGHADDAPRRPPGARDPERGPGRVERQHQHGGPQPARRRVIAGLGRASQARPFARLDDRDGSQQPGECVLLVVHAGLAIEEPRALHPLRPGGVRGVLAVGLRFQRQPGDAGGTFGDRLSQVGQPGLRPGGQPPPREGLAHHAVAAAAGRVGAPHQPAPRPETLSDPPRLDAEQLGLAARVVHLVLGERRAATFGELHGLGRAVGGPVIGNRRPVILDLVARCRQVGADAVRCLAPTLAREGPVEAGQGPVGLARVVLGVHRRPPAPRVPGHRTRAPHPTARSGRAGSARAGAAGRRSGCHRWPPGEWSARRPGARLRPW